LIKPDFLFTLSLAGTKHKQPSSPIRRWLPLMKSRLSYPKRWRLPCVFYCGVLLLVAGSVKAPAQKIVSRQGKTAASQQKTDASPALQCTLQKAPVVRGIALGAKLAALLARYPQFEADYQLAVRQENERVKAGGSPLARYHLTSLLHRVRDEADGMVDDSADFDGLDSIEVNFYKEQVLDVSFTYADYQPIGINDFVEQAANTLKLPNKGWRALDDASAELICREFKVNVVLAGNNRKAVLYLQDVTLFEEMNAAAKKRTELEERKRKVFKP
jgi:hypothetical protein